MDSKTALDTELSIRLEKVLLIRAQIQAGLYHVPAEEIADRMLQRAGQIHSSDNKPCSDRD